MGKKTVAVILAAGKSIRMHSEVHKQFMLLAGRPVLYYSLKAFSDSRVDEIVVVTEKDEIDRVQKEIVGCGGFDRVKTVVAGGRERYHSTYAGLLACEDCDLVLIHDAARPLITEEIIERALQEVLKYPAVAVGMPSNDTIRLVDEEQYAVSTPPRERLWITQTPQAFSYRVLMDAYARMWRETGEDERGVFHGTPPACPITDDAMVTETYGGVRVKMIEGDYRNLKITTAGDILLAESILDSLK